MGDFCLFCTQSELETLTQEGFQFFLDLFSQVSWPANTNDPVIGIPQIFEADEVRLVHFYGRDTSNLSYQFSEFFSTGCSFLDEASFLLRQFLVEQVWPFPLATLLYLFAQFLDFFI